MSLRERIVKGRKIGKRGKEKENRKRAKGGFIIGKKKRWAYKRRN